MIKPAPPFDRRCDPEITYVLSRFRSRADDCRLRADEIDGILWLRPGSAVELSANRRPDKSTETRIRRFCEVVDIAGALLGGLDQVAEWLRIPILGLGGVTPLSLLVSEPEGLAAIRNQLRNEADEINASGQF